MVEDPCVFGSRLKDAVDDVLTRKMVRAVTRAALADALTQDTVIDALVSAIKDYEVYKQYLTACVAPVRERIAAEYSANILSTMFIALHNESIVGDLPLSDNSTDMPATAPESRGGCNAKSDGTTTTAPKMDAGAEFLRKLLEYKLQYTPSTEVQWQHQRS